jgi:hypothetical protein
MKKNCFIISTHNYFIFHEFTKTNTYEEATDLITEVFLIESAGTDRYHWHAG